MNERRYMVATITTPCLADVLAGRAVVENIPNGARVIRCAYDIARDGVAMLLEHPSFDPVEPNIEAPELYLAIRVGARQ